MMPRIVCFALCILQSIIFTNGQSVQSNAPVESCVPGTTTLRCANNYVPVVKSAFYGVAQIPNDCAYRTGDCIADAMNIIICSSDTVACSIYGVKKKLPQCNDQMSSYLHIEYDCVPISMNNAAEVYDVCQNGSDITSDQGILRSPGYPSQFQTTTAECFRAIQVPSNKTIRLWLSDLNIGSSGIDCAKDHVFVVDSVQTYRHCGVKRLGYPYLCSPTILIQYFVTSKSTFYRGMRMYFDIVDRPSDDGCPPTGGTITPVPDSTTTRTTLVPDSSTAVPIFVTLGIASPVRTFQICKGESFALSCPKDYGIAVTTSLFGVTKSGQCEPHDVSQHCVVITDPQFYCRQTCTYFHSGNQRVPSCSNQTATYQYVEYQCIPTKSDLITNDTSCSTDGTKTPIKVNRRGRMRNSGFPTFQKANCTYRLTTDPGYVMNIYSIDISLNNYDSDCKGNKLTFLEDGEAAGTEICEHRKYDLVYSSCSNEFDLRYTIGDSSQLFSYGFELYIESQTRPLDWSCGKPLSTTSRSTILTTPFITPTAIAPTTSGNLMAALPEIEHDICYGKSLTYTCPTGYTFMILGAYYGVKKQASNKCEFTQGDCVQEALATLTQCKNDAANCYILYSTKRRLALCSDNYADYLHITSQCVPSRGVGATPTLRTYDICESNAVITDFNGVVTSPGFPAYRQTTNVCERTIVGIQDRVLKIWMNEMAIASGGVRASSDDSGTPDVVIYKTDETDDIDELIRMNPAVRETCVKDYLIINGPTTAYVFCGTRKLALAPLCASSVTIKYQTASPPNFLFKGFKFYFEWVPKPLEITCGLPTDLSTTTPIDEPIPTWAQNLNPSPIFSKHICLGASTTLRCPRPNDYVLAIVGSNYGVTATGTCQVPSLDDCEQEASLDLTCTHSCSIQYDIPKPLSACGMRNADYLQVDYECIPTRLPNNENPTDICSSTTTDTIAIDSGMIISPQYPTLGAARTCSKKIETLPNKAWEIFIVDLFLEAANDNDQCLDASLTITDGTDKTILCGLRPPQYLTLTCSNIVQFNFVSTHQALGYRGFKLYFRTVNALPVWACPPVLSNITSTTTKSTPKPLATTTLLPPSIQISAFGGTTNGTRKYCQFPFIYQGNPQTSCLRTDPPGPGTGSSVIQPWCSLTGNYDTDRQWGFCNLGVTDPTIYNVCRSQSQSLKCPPGYVIDIITANYAAKPNGNIDAAACAYDKNDCFQSDASTIQPVCAGKPSCVAFHFAKTLASCQNRPSAYFHIDYNCIPNDIQDITTFNMCNNDFVPQADTQRGYIISPNYPTATNGINCTFNLRTTKPNQDIYLYALNIDLNAPTVFGQPCSKDRLIIQADSGQREVCGRVYTDLLVNTCHSSVTLQLIRASDARGQGVKLYFEFRERQPQVACEPLVTTTTRAPSSTLSPTLPTTTVSSARPVYFPHPSPRFFNTLCYPDFSALFGLNNIRCQPDYVIVIHRAFHGTGARCDYTPGDCTSEADTVYRTCSGKQACSVSFTNTVSLPECSGVAAKYLFIEYQCLPTLAIAESKADLCTVQPNQLNSISGILTSASYPSYTPTQCLTASLAPLNGSNTVLYMFLLDMNIDEPNLSTGNCTDDYLSLSYQCNGQQNPIRLCGTRSTELLFDTCAPNDRVTISYSMVSQDAQSRRGFALLYHFMPMTTDPVTPIPSTTTKPTTTSPAVPPGPGPVSFQIQASTSCVQRSITLSCTAGYVLILHKVYLGVSRTDSCAYVPGDCYEDRAASYNGCAGKLSCFIFPPLVAIKQCNNSKSSYLYTEHECIPTRPKLNLDVCNSSGRTERVEGGALVSTTDYTATSNQCQVQLQSNPLLGTQIHRAFKIYILSLNLPTQPTAREQGSQCGPSDPSIEIDDPEQDVTRLCGSSHARYLLETCADTISIRFNNFLVAGSTARYKGFDIYVESIVNDKCRVNPTTTPTVPTDPFTVQNKVACALANGRERVNFGCTPNHGLIFLQSYQYVTKRPDQCDVSQYNCLYPSEQPQAQCSGQQSCSYIYNSPTSSATSICQNSRADAVQFYYQCLPMRPSIQYSKFTFCYDKKVTSNSGFIETSGYPYSYPYGQQCSITLPMPADNQIKRFSVYLYVVELSIRDASVISSPNPADCYDAIAYTDQNNTKLLCGKLDQPFFEYQTDKTELVISLNTLGASSSGETTTWQGARLFFIIGDQSFPSPPAGLATTTKRPIIESTTTTDKDVTVELSTKKPKKKKNSGLLLGILIPVLILALLAIIGLVYYRRKKSLGANAPGVTYIRDKDEVNGTATNGSLGQRSSIPSSSLTGKTSGFTSPFFAQKAATETTPDI